MTEPSRRSSRIALAAGIGVALAAAAAGYVVGRSASVPPKPAPTTVTPPPEPPRLPSVAPLDRRDMLQAVTVAADAYSQGQAGTDANAKLIGRRFEVRIPFGCYGALPDDLALPLRWSYDAEAQALRISVTPEVWTDVAWIRALAGDTVEAVEGFWLPRPWSTAESCPTSEARDVLPPILPAPQQTVGLVQFFEAEGSRVPRRDGKAYETVEKVGLESLQATEGFRLVLSGRIGALPNGQPVGCHGAGAELRPTCLIAVDINRVAIENPLSRRQLAEWTF